MGSPHPLHRLAEEQVKTAQTRLSEAQYDYKIAEVMLAYSAGGRISWRSIQRWTSRRPSSSVVREVSFVFRTKLRAYSVWSGMGRGVFAACYKP